jgi:hypothetical protein
MSARIQKMEILDDAMAAILRQKTPAERLAIANGMWRFARDMIRATIKREHPDWSEGEVSRMVARRLSQDGVEEEFSKKLPLSLFV